MTNSVSAKPHKWVLITGASSGIGLELAHVFARHRYNVVITSRDEAALQELAQDLEKKHGVKAHVILADLTQAAAPGELFAAVQQLKVEIDVLINNAGFGKFGFFYETEMEEELAMIEVNIAALTQLTKLFLKPMLARRSGRIMNVASTAGFLPGPMMAVYYASKAYVLSFTEALANELEGSGVSITALCPGYTKSGFQERANLQTSKLANAIGMDAREVAEVGYRGLIRRKTVVIPGRRNRAFVNLKRILPRKTTAQIVRFVQERNEGR